VAHREFNGGGGPQRDLGSTQRPHALALSSAQLGIWLAQKLDPSSPAYNIGEYLELNGPIDAGLFEQALRRVVSETDALRVHIADGASCH
jgi:nonribosomal peptide synthetase DhbF